MSETKNNLDAITNSSVIPKEAFHEGKPLIAKHFFTPSHAPLEQSNGFQFVLNGLRRCWKWALPLGLLLGFGSAAAVYLTFNPSYEAVAWLKIEARPQYIAFETNPEDRDSSRIFVQTQIELLRSPLVLGPVITEPEIARMPEIATRSDPVPWLAKKIGINAVGESELFKVAYAAHDPKAAAKVLNTVMDEYFLLRGREDASRTEQVIGILEQERNKRVAEVTQMRETVRELAKQATGKDPFAGSVESTVVLNHPLAELQNHLVTAEVEQEVLKARIKAFKETAAKEAPISDAVVENKISMHPEILRLKQDLMSLYSQLRNLDSISVRKEKDPARQQLTREINETQTALQQLHRELQKQIRIELQSAAAAKCSEQIAALQTDLESRRIAAEMMRERYESQMKDQQQTNGDTLQLQFKQGELQCAEKIYELISERIVKLRTETGALDRVVCMQRADPPNVPIERYPYRDLLLALLAGFALPFGLALGSERLIHRVADASNLENASHLPVVGEIARLPSPRRLERRGASLQTGLDLRMFEESINSLRTTLMLAEDLHDLRILAVTSAVTHEGKTSVAVQLAMSLARTTNKPVLLIDGDMRSPNLHDIFDVKLAPGLAKVLEGKTSLEEAIVATSCPALDLLPAGKLASNPHQLLGSSGFSALLESISGKYRYVIIDTPPVLAASESLMLAKMAEASLVCVLRDVSRIDQVKKAYQRLQIAGGKPVGLVLNGVPTKTYAYHYGNYDFTNR